MSAHLAYSETGRKVGEEPAELAVVNQGGELLCPGVHVGGISHIGGHDAELRGILSQEVAHLDKEVFHQQLGLHDAVTAAQVVGGVGSAQHALRAQVEHAYSHLQLLVDGQVLSGCRRLSDL